MWSISRTQDWEKYRAAQRHAQLVYEDAERTFTERSKSLLTDAPNQRKLWSIVKTTIFDVSSSLSPLVARGSKLVWSADENASVFSAHFDARQCKDSF